LPLLYTKTVDKGGSYENHARKTPKGLYWVIDHQIKVIKP
jgi:hypothetical protein